MRAKTVVGMAALVAGAALVPQRAVQAQWAGCSPGTLTVCAAFNASTAQVNGTWHLYLHVWNLYDGSAASGLSHVITFAGIGNSAWSGTATFVAATFNGSSVNWGLDNDPNHNIVGNMVGAGAVSETGVTEGLVGPGTTPPPGHYVSGTYPNGPSLDLDFTTSSQFVLNGAVYGWHSQAINSTSCSTWADSQGHSTNTDLANCTGVVPEPITITLLVTGLAGMGGVGLVRRRRGLDVQSD